MDATDIPLGRLATKVATILRGKDKPTFTSHIDTGGFVVVVNASRVKLTGRKPTDKFYYSHSQKPGGLKAISAQDMLERDPSRIISLAVRGMMPKSSLAKKQLTKLKVYADDVHPHGAQRPEKIEV